MKKEIRIALGYQVELLSNSLFYKLAKTFVNSGYKVTVVGIKRVATLSKTTSSYVRSIQSFENKLINTEYIEIPVKMRYAFGIRNFIGVLNYQINTFFRLMKKMKEIDIYYAIDLLMAIPFFWASLLSRKPFIYHIADKFIDSYKVPKVLKPVFSLMDLILISHAKLIIVPHESRIDSFLRRYKDKIIVVYNTPEDINDELKQDIVSSDDNSNKRLKIAYFGVLTEDRFIRQLCDIVMRDPRLELVIGGFGPLEDFVLLQSSKCSRIKFYGKIPYDTVLQIQKEADLLIAMYDPSVKNNKNSSPNKLYEAMMLGKPIIIAKGMGIDNFVEGNVIGFVSEYSVKDFERTIEKIIQSQEEELMVCGLRGRELYEKKYRWDLMSSRIIHAIKKLEKSGC